MLFTERCSFARMAMVAVQNDLQQPEDAIIMLGDENVYQVRWSPGKQQLCKVRLQFG